MSYELGVMLARRKPPLSIGVGVEVC
jgi:hypothetical protein